MKTDTSEPETDAMRYRRYGFNHGHIFINDFMLTNVGGDWA